MTDHDETLRALMAKWRDEGEVTPHFTRAKAKFQCADDLEAALRVPVDRPPDEEAKNPPCTDCGGPHPFDTSVPSVLWNQVIRPLNGSDYRCLTCIVREFAKAGVSFCAELYGDEFHGLPIAVHFNSQESKAAQLIQDENNALRWRLRELGEAPGTVDRPRGHEQDTEGVKFRYKRCRCGHFAHVHASTHPNVAHDDTSCFRCDCKAFAWDNQPIGGHEQEQADPTRVDGLS